MLGIYSKRELLNNNLNRKGDYKMTYNNIQNFKYKQMLASLLCVGALVNTQPTEAQCSSSRSEENDVRGIHLRPQFNYEKSRDENELYRSKQSILSDLKDEIRCLKNINHGKRMQKAGKHAEKASECLKEFAPLVLTICTRIPAVAPVIAPLYVSSRLTCKGVEKALPRIGDKMKVHYTQKRKDIKENLKKMDVSYLNDQVNELERKSKSFHKKSTKKIFKKLIKERKELIENLQPKTVSPAVTVTLSR